MQLTTDLDSASIIIGVSKSVSRAHCGHHLKANASANKEEIENFSRRVAANLTRAV